MKRTLTTITTGIAVAIVVGSSILIGAGPAAAQPAAAPNGLPSEQFTVTSDSPIDPDTGNPTSVFGTSVILTVSVTVPNQSNRVTGRSADTAAALAASCGPLARPAGTTVARCAELRVADVDSSGDNYDQSFPLSNHSLDGQGNDVYSASVTFDNLPIGPHQVDAYYSESDSTLRPDLAQNGEEALHASLVQDVVAPSTGPTTRPSKTVLTSSTNPSDSGAPVIFTATVTPADNGSGTPSGTVIFAADGTNHPETLSSGGVATFEDDTLTDGAHEVTATYTGDSIFTASADNILQVVGDGGGTGGLNGLLFTEPGTAALGLINADGASQDIPLRASSAPSALAIGPDSRVWIVEAGKDAIAAFDTTGHETDFALPTDAFPTSIAAGSDGRMWFTEPGLHRIAAITTSGTITNYSLGKHAEPYELAAGPNGRLWFTQPDRDRIGRIRTNGHHKSFPVRVNSKPLGITAGPDGAIWFTEQAKRRIGRITTAGNVTEVKVDHGSRPSAIVTGPDGKLWFTEPGRSKIGRISTTGDVTSFNVRSGSQPSSIVMGPDQRLWFTEPGVSRIGTMTRTGTFIDYAVASGSAPSDIISLS